MMNGRFKPVTGLRIAQYGLTFWIVLSLNFVLPRLMPGNPLAELDNPQGLPVPLSAEQRSKLLAYYGLDKPLLQQYSDYMLALARGDLGWSLSYHVPVRDVILTRLRWTVLLVGTATLIYVVLGIALGALSAWRRGSWLDAALLATNITAGALPSFFLGMLLIISLAFKLGWFPLGGAQSPRMLNATGLARWMDIAKHMALPVATLVLTNLHDVYYLTRSSMLSVLGETFLSVARAKGLREQIVLFRHALPNALLPVITLVAMRLGFVVMGAMLVEVTFAYPGIGSAIVEASVSRDYPLLQGAFALTTFSIMAANLLADWLYGLLDPRVSHRQ